MEVRIGFFIQQPHDNVPRGPNVRSYQQVLFHATFPYLHGATADFSSRSIILRHTYRYVCYNHLVIIACTMG